MIRQEYVCAYAAVSVADGELDTLILPQVEAASRHPNDRIILALDGIVVMPLSFQSSALTHATGLFTGTQSC